MTLLTYFLWRHLPVLWPFSSDVTNPSPMTSSLQADVWSFGITLIELAEMLPPYSDMHPLRVLFKIPKAEPPTFREPEKWFVCRGTKGYEGIWRGMKGYEGYVGVWRGMKGHEGIWRDMKGVWRGYKGGMKGYEGVWRGTGYISIYICVCVCL